MPRPTTSLTKELDLCRKPGDIVCARDCSQILLCVTKPDGQLGPLVVETCSAGQHCYAPVKACVQADSCDPATRPAFECTKATSFPDPYDCTIYHICYQLPDETFAGDQIACDAGFAFDPLRKVCGFAINQTAGYPRVCDEVPVPTCVEPGQTGALVENPSMYYVCKVGTFLYPVLYECPVGQVYVDDQQSCQPESLDEFDERMGALLHLAKVERDWGRRNNEYVYRYYDEDD